MPEIVLDRVSRSYPGGATAVSALSLSIAAGECVSLLGPSGCGKTTTLRLIAGLERPDDGSIRLSGRVVNGVPPVRRGVALVSQDAVLFPHWTVERNLLGTAGSRGVSVGEFRESVVQALGLGPLLYRYPDQLSGGERQRAALGRLLLGSAEILLLDEPLSRLDAGRRVELRSVVRELIARRGATAVWVTHDQAEALAVGDRVAVMQGGRIEQFAPPATIYEEPASVFVAQFVGEPAINLAELRVSFQGGQWVGHGLGLAWPFPSGFAGQGLVDQESLLWCGVRPERVRLEQSARPGEVCLSGVVKSVQFQGSRTVVTVVVAGSGRNQDWRVAVGEAVRQRPGQEVPLSFGLRDALWFDPATGRNVRRKEA